MVGKEERTLRVHCLIKGNLTLKGNVHRQKCSRASSLNSLVTRQSRAGPQQGLGFLGCSVSPS